MPASSSAPRNYFLGRDIVRTRISRRNQVIQNKPVNKEPESIDSRIPKRKRSRVSICGPPSNSLPQFRKIVSLPSKTEDTNKEVQLKKEKFAAEFISFFFVRFMRRQVLAASSSNLVLVPKRKASKISYERRVHLFQIRYFPAIKKIITHIYAATIRRRFLMLRSLAVGIQVVFRRFLYKSGQASSLDCIHRLSLNSYEIKMIEIDLSMEKSEIDAMHLDQTEKNQTQDLIINNSKNPPNYSDVCTVQDKVSFSSDNLNSVNQKIIDSASFRVKESDAETININHQPEDNEVFLSNRLRSSIEIFDENSLEAKLQKPFSSVDESKFTPKSLNLRCQSENMAIDGCENIPKSYPSDIHKTDAGEDKKPNSIIRPLSNQAELDRLTFKNTRLNGGYKRVRIRKTNHVVVGEPPISPSDSFIKSNGRRRKWADFASASESISRQWKIFSATLNNVRDTKDGIRRVHWAPNIMVASYSSIDEPLVRESVDLKKEIVQSSICPSGILRAASGPLDNVEPHPGQEKIPVEVRSVKYVSKERRKPNH